MGSVELSEKEKQIKEFLPLCDELKQVILNDMEHVHKMPKEAIQWAEEMIDYNCKGGKIIRGLSVLHSVQAILQGQGVEVTEDAKKKASILGWCIEWLQAFFLVADDVMDDSITRRGQPCWYRLPKVKLIAINDAFLLETFVFKILQKYFKTEPYYLQLIELFREVIYQTELGQLLDLTSQPMDSDKVDLSRFSIERYRNIVIFKTAYYTFYLSAACAMHLCGVKEEQCFSSAQEICVQIGEYFQTQDDYLDCFGDPKVIGKIGTDIQDSKCSWLVVQALSRANAEQRELLEQNYGKNEPEAIEKVKQLYRELDLPAVYATFEQNIHKEITGKIEQVQNMEAAVFKQMIAKIYKRSA